MLKPVLKTLLVAGGILSPALAWGGILTADEAKGVATEFFRNAELSRLASPDALTLAHVESVASAPAYYVFNATDERGFIIVSADDSALPVVAYSFSSIWEPRNVPELAGSLLENAGYIPQPLSLRMPAKNSGLAQKVLTTPTWSQEAPFNCMIPNHPLVGCVGTALAEIMKYHSYPANRPASLVKDGEPAAYDWGNMRNDNYRSGYSAVEGDAVATLVADAAIAIGTDFGMSSSSAFEVKVPYALVSMFGYDAGVSYKKGAEMDRESWDALIVNEIDEDRPVLYCGQDVSAGHAFVCDGYEMHGPVTYLHINWGWGGSADGFYASDALNPTVSSTHHFNDLTTIVYNIKPAASVQSWSPIHITSDECQVGMTLDVTDLQPGTSFKLRAGSLKNITNDNFSGSIALAVFTADGTFRQLLCDERKFGLKSLTSVKYIDFNGTVPANVAIGDGDVIRLVTKNDNSGEWLPVANDLMTVGEIKCKGYDIPYFSISIPAQLEGVEITYDEPRVIKCRDFSFKVAATSPDKVVTVKANGFILTPGAENRYTLSNVTSDQDVTIIVQNAADVVSKRSVWVEAGKLSQTIKETETGTIKDLTLYGSIDANDFTFIRERMKLNRLDISGVNIVANGANPANAIPAKALSGCGSLQQIILPRNVNTFKSGCFSYSGLTSIEIPASVSTWEYNIFLGCSGLSEVIVRRSSPAWINWCVFQGTPKSKLIVPVGASAAYMGKDYWKEFKTIEEQNAEAATSYTVTVQDMSGIKFVPVTESSEVAPGTKYEFKVETDDSYGDATVELYVNSTRLYAGQDGVFSFTVNSNSLIHANFRQPERSGADSPWKITGAAGGVGLVTDMVNVAAGRAFTIRANALAIPSDNANVYYAAALTDKDGRIKEIISQTILNASYNFGNLPNNFNCQVKESTVREGNMIRIVTSLDKKLWSLVNADNDTIVDRLDAIGNRVVYYNVNMPQNVQGAVIQGGATQVVRGMPFNLKVTPVSVDDRITVAVNGINKVVDAAIANVSIPAVLEDLEISIQVNPKGANSYTVVNVREGELDAKIAQCPARLKVIGVMRSEDFDAFRKHASTIVDLDLADVTIKGAVDLANAIPSKAFASTGFEQTALKNIILPTNLVNIEENAFYRCVGISEITLPSTVAYVGSGAFSTCAGLNKIIVQGTLPPATGTMNPFPDNSAGITLEVPAGAEGAYSTATYWKDLGQATSKKYYNIQIDPERSFNYNEHYTLTKIDVSGKKVSVTIGLPNFTPTSYKKNPTYRPGVAFKLYDNGKDVTTTSSYVCEGQHSVELDPDPFYKPGSAKYPQDHTIDVVFHYPIDIHCPSGLKAEFVELNEANLWRSANMNLFDPNSNAVRNLFKEGEDYKFKVAAEAQNVEAKVKCVSRNLVSFGENPQFTNVESVLTPDENGIYTISNLQGEISITVTADLVVEDGSVIPSEEIALVSADDAALLTNIGVSGEVSEDTFKEIREKFNSLETLNMSEMSNESIPDNAFSNMEKLESVVIPESVKYIGSGAFAGCSNLESVTLPGVLSIGDGAFEGCGSLTSVTVLGVAESVAEEASGLRAPAASGITEASFRGLNPNCLIYLSEGFEAGVGETPNVIVNGNGVRVASADIALDGEYPFNAPASFSLADHSISLTLEIPGTVSDDNDGWRGIVLPFTPDSVKYGVEFTPRGEKVLNLLSFSEGEDALSSQDTIVANRPYLASVYAPFAKVPVTFVAKGKSTAEEFVYDVNYTPAAEEISARGGMFTLRGSFDGIADIAEAYVLDEAGVAFSRVVADSVAALRPFSVYANANVADAPASLAVGTHPIWVLNPVSSRVSGSKLYRSNTIDLASETPGASIYYTLDGSDPIGSETRIAYSSPFTLDADSVAINAVAELKGYVSDAVSMTYELRKTTVDYNFEEGWSWISHNVENEIAVKDIMGENVDRVLSQTQEAIRDPQLGVVGNLENLNPLEAYKVFVEGENANSVVNGISFDPSTPVTLQKGWNWIGAPIEDGSLALGDLFANLVAEEGDMVVGREGFAQADSEGNWVGDLNALIHGRGYMYLSGSERSFSYNTVPSEDASVENVAKVVAVAPWIAERSKYPSVMPVISRVVTEGGLLAEDGEFEVGAFCGDECRGTGVYVDGMFMVSVFGNTGDEISFRLLSVPSGRESILSQTILFSENPVGSLKSPYIIDASETTTVDGVSAGDCRLYVENGTLVIVGDIDSIQLVEVYDVAGVKKVPTYVMAGDSMKIDSLDAGVYIVVIKSDKGRSSHKIEIK